MLFLIFRYFGPPEVVRSRSSVLTDNLQTSATSFWVSSGCISDRLDSGDHEITGGVSKSRELSADFFTAVSRELYGVLHVFFTPADEAGG
jgi:hypothetical protein